MGYEDEPGGARVRIEQGTQGLVVDVASEDDDLKTVMAAASQEFNRRSDEWAAVNHTDVIDVVKRDDIR